MSARQKGNARSSGYDRNADDWYQEPTRAIEALLNVERFLGPIHDPACGEGRIPLAAISRGHQATGADIVDRGYGDVRDFLTDNSHYENIITNPPFNIAMTFAMHALQHTSGKVAILQRLAWLEGTARYNSLFAPGYLRRVWVFSGRISMPPGGMDVPAKNGSVAFAWYVFEHNGTAGERPELGWLP